MALTEITFGENTYHVNRGNTGTISDSCETLISVLFLTVPLIANVTSGTQYGPQNSLTGTATGGGGGPTYYSYSG